MWYIYTMEYYSAIKKNEILPFAAKWMDLKMTVISEISQKDALTSYDITYVWNLTHETKNMYKTETVSKTYRRDLWLPR